MKNHKKRDFYVTPDPKIQLVCATTKSRDRKIFCGLTTYVHMYIELL